MGLPIFEQEDLPTVQAGKIINTAQEKSVNFLKNAWRADLYVAGAADTFGSSLANISNFAGITDIDTTDGIMPASWETYQSSRGAYTATADIASLFLVAGAASKAVQSTGRIAQAAKQAGMSDKMAGRVFADRSKALQIRQEYDTFAAKMSEELGSRGLSWSGSGDVAVGWASVAGKHTPEQLKKLGLKASQGAAVRETIASEAAVLATMNDSALVFGEDGDLMTYLMTAGMVGGVVSGLDNVIATAGYRRSLAQAKQGNSELRKAALKNEVAGGAGLSDSTGLRWTAQEDAADRLRRAEALIGDVNSAGFDETIASNVRQEAVIVAQEARTTMARTSQALANDKVLDNVSYRGKLEKGQIEATTKWSKENRAGMVGVQSLENADVTIRYNEEYTKRYANAQKTYKNPDDAARAKLAFKEIDSMHPAVLEADGAVNLSATRKTPWQEIDADPTAAPVMHNKTSMRLRGKEAPNVALNDAGFLSKIVGKKSNLVVREGSLNFQEATGSYSLLAKADKLDFSAKFAKVFDGDTDALPYQTLDALSADRLEFSNDLLAQNPKLQELVNEQMSGVLESKIMNKKFKAFLDVQKRGEENPVDMSKRFNMRMHDDQGLPSELHRALTTLAETGETDLNAFVKNPQDLAKALAGLAGGAADKPMLNKIVKKIESQIRGGNMLTLHEQPKPVGMLRKILDGASDTDISLAKIAEFARRTRFAMLGNSQEPMIRSIVDSMQELSNTALVGATDVASIARDTLMENNSIKSRLARATTTTTQRFRDNMAMQHAHTLGQTAQRQFNAIADAMLTPIAQEHRRLMSEKKFSVLAQHSDYTTAVRQGATLEEDFLQVGLNKLDMTNHRVRAMTERLFKKTPEQLADGDELYLFDLAKAANGEYVPIKITDEAASFTNMMIDASYSQLKSMNQLAKMMGLKETVRVRGHVPVADFSKLQVRYVGDENGKIVGYVTGKTTEEAESVLKNAIDFSNSNGKRHIAIAPSMVQGYMDALDNMHFSNMVNMGDSARQTGATKGRSPTGVTDVSGDIGSDQLLALRENMKSVKDRTVYAMMEPSILQNRQLMAQGNATEGGRRALDRSGDPRFFNAHQEWENLLFARSGTPKGSIAHKADDMVSRAIESIWDAAAQRFAGTKSNMEMTASQKAAYEKMLGSDYNPMGNALEAAERLKTKRSIDDRRVAQSLQAANKVTAEVFLKFANLPHAILNVMSAAVTTPAVIQQIVRREGESLSDFRDRAGVMAEYIDETGAVSISATKVLTSGTSFFHSQASKAVIAEAEKRGFITANMLEEFNSAIHATPNRVTEMAEHGRKYLDFINGPINLANKALGRKASADNIAEASENFTRTYFHSVGYNYINKMGKQGLTEGEKHAFANMFANQNVADYSPNIRGQAFRGVTGIPIGLFQSFGINYLQRMFRYIENKDSRALAVQAGMQTAFFGAQGLPGWPAINSAFMHANERGGDADRDLNDRIYGAYGKHVGDALMLGSVSNLPKLFGASDGLNFYTSGDANPRVFSGLPPSFALAGQTMEMIGKAGASAISDAKRGVASGEFDSMRTAEILTSYAPSRGVRALMEIAMGYSTDRAGDLVAEDTRSGMALLARMMGTRTTDEVNTRQALYKNRQDEQHRRARLTQVGRAFTAAVRSASENGDRDFEVTQEFLKPYLQQMLAAGGRQDTARQFFRRALEKANTPEVEFAMRGFVKDGNVKGGNIFTSSVERLGLTGYDVDALP